MKKTNLIIGLLINAEMERQSIQKADRDSIQKLILRLIENNSSTMLSVSGLKLPKFLCNWWNECDKRKYS